jgi:hypothetical protein
MGPAVPTCRSSATIDPDEHGRGLCIVAALSARYGVEVHPEGTSRWAEVLAG